jgi:hypothetical protein
MLVEDVEEVDEMGVSTGNVFKRAKVRIPKKDALILAAIKKGHRGDMRAVEFIFDRIEGKATQNLNVQGDIGIGSFEEMMQTIAKRKKENDERGSVDKLAE